MHWALAVATELGVPFEVVRAAPNSVVSPPVRVCSEVGGIMVVSDYGTTRRKSGP
jgi:hypothetical protein